MKMKKQTEYLWTRFYVERIVALIKKRKIKNPIVDWVNCTIKNKPKNN